MRLPSPLVIATLMLAAPPSLLHAQSGGFASAGQPTAGASGTSLESRAVPAPTQSPEASPQTSDHGPMASAAPTEASTATDFGTPADVGQVPLPAPEELSTTASAPSDASIDANPDANPDASSGPSLAAATDGVRAHVAREDLSHNASAHQGGIGMPGVLMIVGAAAILIGLLIGGGAGTAIAVAGAVAGLYGLYLYLK